jgi:hypothetical protein
VAFASGVARRTNKGVLVEEASTNLCLQSQAFDSVWSPIGGSVTANGAVAPDGTTTADLINEDGATSAHRIDQPVTVAAGAATFSFYVKYAGRQWLRIEPYNTAAPGTNAVWFDIQNGVKGTQQANCTGAITALGNGWYRLTWTATVTAATLTLSIRGALADGSGTNYAGLNGGAYYLWGAQLEAASTASSYIVTTTTSATRAADVISIAQSMVAPFSAVTEFEPNIIGTDQRVFAISDGTSDNWLLMWLNLGAPTASVRSGGSSQANIAVGVAATAGSLIKFAARCATDNVQAARGGTLGSPDTSATAPTGVTTLSIGSTSSVAYLNGYVRRAIVYPRALSDAELQAMTR